MRELTERRELCRARSRVTGAPCRWPAIKGGVVCRYHGGSAPQVKRKAAERLAALRALARTVTGRPRTPGELIAAAVRAATRQLDPALREKAAERLTAELRGLVEPAAPRKRRPERPVEPLAVADAPSDPGAVLSPQASNGGAGGAVSSGGEDGASIVLPLTRAPACPGCGRPRTPEHERRCGFVAAELRGGVW